MSHICLKRLPGYKRGQAIRLLSCSTGTRSDGFAQNIANKLNATVYAPSDILWAYPNGRHVIAAAKPSSRDPNVMVPDLRRIGRFVKYTPGGNRRVVQNAIEVRERRDQLEEARVMYSIEPDFPY